MANVALETELEQKQLAIRRELHEIREEKRQLEMASQIGRFFKYRNCYSSDESWWLYGTYLRVGKKVYCVRFQTDCNGKFDIEHRQELWPQNGWQEIPRTEYFRELRKAQRLIYKFERIARRKP